MNGQSGCVLMHSSIWSPEVYRLFGYECSAIPSQVKMPCFNSSTNQFRSAKHFNAYLTRAAITNESFLCGVLGAATRAYVVNLDPMVHDFAHNSVDRRVERVDCAFDGFCGEPPHNTADGANCVVMVRWID